MSFVVSTKSIRFVALMVLGICTLGLTSSSEAAGGSWGSSRGGFASSGGWSSSGGLQSGRAPVRNLLGRLNSRISNIGGGSSGGSSGGFTGSRGGLLSGGSSGGAFGLRNGWGSSGGSTGTSFNYGSSGGYASTGSSYGSSGSTLVSTTPNYSIPNYSNGNYLMETSYPIGDYGFQPGYPVQTMMGTSPMVEAPIVDGGSINDMLDGSQSPPIEGGENSQDYYRKVQPATGQPGSGQPGSGQTPPTGEKPLGPVEDSTMKTIPGDSKAVLNVEVPQQAKVLINGNPTTTKGSFRSYVSSKLTEDRDYQYEVTAIIIQDGHETVRTELVSMRPGINRTVKFDFSEPVTSLALKVPADAKVSICGKEMKQTGPLRSFTTNRLKEGKVWKDYQVKVEYLVNGEKRVEEKTLDLRAGESYELAIGNVATPDRVASR